MWERIEVPQGHPGLITKPGWPEGQVVKSPGRGPVDGGPPWMGEVSADCWQGLEEQSPLLHPVLLLTPVNAPGLGLGLGSGSGSGSGLGLG